jgi:hypothetical protein
LEQRSHARAARSQDDVRRERDQFRRVAAKALGIAGGPACLFFSRDLFSAGSPESRKRPRDASRE